MAETVNGRPPEPDFVAFIGIDWADQKHCWKLAVVGTQATETGELKQTPEELSSWAAALHHRFGGRPVAVALEQSRLEQPSAGRPENVFPTGTGLDRYRYDDGL
jgi:hypothetical protein